MESAITIGAVQLSSQDDVPANLARVAALAGQARERGAQVVVLPENFAFMGAEADKAQVAEELEAGSGPIAQSLTELARTLGVWIVAGGMPERSPDPVRPFNTCAVVDPEGRLAARYRKIHLFDVDLPDGSRYRESASTSPGQTPVTVDVGGARFGLSICYDLRFPELYRALSSAGAEVLVVPAAFTVATGKDHWSVLLRARAIEAQTYVVASAQWGTHPRGRQTFGKSCVVDPWGEVVAQVSEGEGVAVASLSPDYLRRVRAQLPALAHRRLQGTG